MKRLYVYADFDWLEQPELIGTLSYDAVRGGATYGFSFSNKWLAGHGNVFLGEDLRHFPGQQFTRPGNEIFGCFADALPDRWGRTLLNRREQALLDSSEEYFISKERASQIVTEVRNSMKDWKAIALRSGLSQRDINTFEPRINRYL